MATDPHIIAAVERLSAVVRSLQWSAAYAEGLYPAQLQTLQICASRQSEGLTLSTLAAELNVSSASMGDTVSALERKGLLIRKSNPRDRRAVVVELTDEGRRVLDRVQQWDTPLRGALEALPEARRETGYEFLLEVLRQLWHNGVITMPRMCLTCRWLHYDKRSYIATYRCQLLEMELVPLQLRLECPDHQSLDT
ncbi:MAG: MarR family transcriptional regulator [Chlorobi bacterium]|nr:MarR family transcriptional regulator [Chlorobiota bacterium]